MNSITSNTPKFFNIISNNISEIENNSPPVSELKYNDIQTKISFIGGHQNTIIEAINKCINHENFNIELIEKQSLPKMHDNQKKWLSEVRSIQINYNVKDLGKCKFSINELTHYLTIGNQKTISKIELIGGFVRRMMTAEYLNEALKAYGVDFPEKLPLKESFF